MYLGTPGRGESFILFLPQLVKVGQAEQQSQTPAKQLMIDIE